MARLTLRLLEAMQEALLFRVAGELDAESCNEKDYEDALSWVSAQINDRTAPVSASQGDPA